VIADLTEFETGKVLEVDLCVVGAGAAGVTIAKEFLGSGLRVCLAEAGGMQEEPETQEIYEGESVGHPFDVHEGRYRVFGGSATRWGGRCATLDPIDFAVRDWVYKSGWPIGLDQLKPYYDRAKVLANFELPWISDDDVPAELGIELPQSSTEGLNPFVWRYAPLGYRLYFDWGRAYGGELKADANTHVLLHANLTALEGTADGSHIQSITVSSLNGVSMKIKARAFVLCCGGIENARLLLHAPANVLGKLNQFDNLGRYFAQHPRGPIATLKTTPETARRLQTLFTVFTRPSGVQYEIGFALSEKAQREHGLLNASAYLTYDARPESAWKSGARLLAAFKSRKLYDNVLHDIVNVASDTGNVATNFYRRVFQGHPAILRDPLVTILIDLEQDPNPQSRVTLSAAKDSLGMCRAKVDWRIAEIERTTARHFNGLIAQQLKQLGLGQTDASAWLTSGEPLRNDELYGTYHHIGTTRMSKDPADGAVNAECRTHGVDNLYLSGCSVFPTGGHANPTLTIVALAIRLSDHLRNQFGKVRGPTRQQAVSA
jgi:choline dehydrogenase-like flavoprotein